MLALGPAKKVTIHLNADTSAQHDFLHREILSFLLDKGIEGATVLHPHAGFGSHRRLHTVDADGAAGDHLPVRIEFIESEQVLNELLQPLLDLVTDGLVEIQDTTVLKMISAKAQVRS
jgi:uncharacterized protein